MQPLLKLCGNHSIDDTNIALKSSAEYIGFVFAESKRRVTSEQLKKWLFNQELREKKLVALFVNEAADFIQSSISDLPIDVIQCHGNESAKRLAEIKQVTHLPVWKAIHHNSEALQIMKTYRGIVDGYIIDCKVGKQWGGTGVSFDWTYIPAYLQEGRAQGVPVFIAGGINPENIDQVLSYEPDGIDVSSGIEEKGKKCNKLIKQLEERMNRI